MAALHCRLAKREPALIAKGHDSVYLQHSGPLAKKRTSRSAEKDPRHPSCSGCETRSVGQYI